MFKYYVHIITLPMVHILFVNDNYVAKRNRFYLSNFSIKFCCCISTVDGRAMARMDSVTLHDGNTNWAGRGVGEGGPLGLGLHTMPQNPPPIPYTPLKGVCMVNNMAVNTQMDCFKGTESEAEMLNSSTLATFHIPSLCVVNCCVMYQWE